jgi:DNA invertase Pin-like site-specific DNA recombinase
MITLEATASKVTTEHQAKLACVYIRQSSMAQVTQHAESTDLQYRLVERAIALGWPRDRVKIIDEDLGKSGASAENRPGFQHLIAEIGLAHIGLVVSLDASRLARNNRDWYQLLELCAVFGTLIADSESLYNPGFYSDRMLLGLSGMMSEAELHQLKLRLHAGELNKARRGELRLPLPAGLLRLPGGEVTLDPDEEVRARIELVFAKFRELGSARAVQRYLWQHQLMLPSRPLRGPAPHALIWLVASSSRVRYILKNPAYAGSYVYGRTTTDPTRRRPNHPHSGLVRRPLEAWTVVLQDRHPGYIPWQEYMANQTRLAGNQNRYEAGRHGVPRKGEALLQGIVRCGRCGAAMCVRYSGPQGEYPVYTCQYAYQNHTSARCQEVRALNLDREVVGLLLEALAPDRIELALAALAQLEQEYELLQKQWRLRLERARYETERARRQYDAVEPENRLVARSLELLWEEKLRRVEHVEQEYERWRLEHSMELTQSEREAILALGADLPKLWHLPTTTVADRKHILRLVVTEVIVDRHRKQGKVCFRVNWQTGATSEHEYRRRVQSYRDHPDREALEQRVRQLHTEEKLDREMADILNAEGFRTARGCSFSSELIWLLRKQWALPAVGPKKQESTLRWEDGSFTVEGAAHILGVFPGTVYKWLLRGQMKGHQVARGTPWRICLNDEEISHWDAYIKRVRRSKKEAL